jgi:hypothetical protein
MSLLSLPAIKKFSALLTVLVFFNYFLASCSKDDPPVQHYFNYKMNNKQGGSTAHNEMTEVNAFFMDNGFIAYSENNSLVIYATMTGGCNEPGKPACYDVTIEVPGLTVGTYTLGENKPGSLQIAEFTATGIEQYLCEQFSPAGDVITVIITEVGEIGGVIMGSFSGTVGGVSLSGEFKVERLT